MSAIGELTCAELTAAYRRGEISPVEVARDCLARIDRHAAINAFLPIEPEGVLAAAAESEARWRAGSPLGPIDGVPASIKDNIWVKGLPTRRGSKTSDPTPAAENSPAVARLREQGAVILGKTCMPEHGWTGVCHSPLTGITRNPWNPDHTPGGSTGGGAVAALLGLGVLHLGTDGAGSLRIPAAFTGVFGMKPSFGRVPVYPALLLNVLSHQGPITRTIADAAVMLSVIAQPDARDMAAWNTPAPDFRAGLDDGVRGLRVAYSPRLGRTAALDPEIEAAARKTARVLEAQGALVEEADPSLERAPDLIRAMWWPVATAIVDAVANDPPRRDGSRSAGDRRTRPGHFGRRLSCRLCRARRIAQLDAALPYALRSVADADHAGDRAQSGARDAGEWRFRRRLDQLVALHLSVQPNAAAGRLGAKRPGKQRPADGGSDRRRGGRGHYGVAGGARDRKGGAVAAATRLQISDVFVDILKC